MVISILLISNSVFSIVPLNPCNCKCFMNNGIISCPEYFLNCILQEIFSNPFSRSFVLFRSKNMVEDMKTQENSEDLLAEFETIKSRSKIQASPYQYVLSWFEAKFEGYNDLKQFMAQKEEERSAEDAASEAENV